jgi:hypothetical protein
MKKTTAKPIKNNIKIYIKKDSNIKMRSFIKMRNKNKIKAKKNIIK